MPPAVRMSGRAGVNGTHNSQPAAQQQQQPSSAATSVVAAIPAYLSKWYEVIGKIGEGTYGVVYLARSRGARSRLLAVKTFKPGKVRLYACTPIPEMEQTNTSTAECQVRIISKHRL